VYPNLRLVVVANMLLAQLPPHSVVESPPHADVQRSEGHFPPYALPQKHSEVYCKPAKAQPLKENTNITK